MFILRHSPNARCFVFLRNFLLPNSRSFSAKEDIPIIPVDDSDDPEEIAAREAEIEMKRNKSRLTPEDYKRQHDTVVLTITEKTRLISKRKAYGVMGEASGVNPTLCWPTREELAFVKEYESVLQPLSIQQLIENNQEAKRLKAENILKRQAEALKKIENIDKEIIEFHKRYALKKAKANELIEKKEKLVNQIRRHFGFQIDPRDQRFKAMLLEIQEKEKKKIKADKKAAKEQGLKSRISQLKEASESTDNL